MESLLLPPSSPVLAIMILDLETHLDIGNGRNEEKDEKVDPLVIGLVALAVCTKYYEGKGSGFSLGSAFEELAPEGYDMNYLKRVEWYILCKYFIDRVPPKTVADFISACLVPREGLISGGEDLISREDTGVGRSVSGEKRALGYGYWRWITYSMTHVSVDPRTIIIAMILLRRYKKRPN
jgi:hypothetical protein